MVERHLAKVNVARSNRVTRFFAKLKERAITTRYDQTVRHFLAAIHLATSVIWLN